MSTSGGDRGGGGAGGAAAAVPNNVARSERHPMDGEVANFYKDRCVLITGATGFMGKVLVEKLLRSCPDLGTIYLLMRPKGGQDVRARLDELLNSKVSFGVRL